MQRLQKLMELAVRSDSDEHFLHSGDKQAVVGDAESCFLLVERVKYEGEQERMSQEQA